MLMFRPFISNTHRLLSSHRPHPNPLNRYTTTTYNSHLDPQTHFYTARILEQYAQHEPNRVTLRRLAKFGKCLNSDKLIKSANYLRLELPIRLAHRLRDFHTVLPFIAVANSHLSKVYKAYWSSFCLLRQFPEIKSVQDNILFCAALKSQLDIHRSVIPSLAHGLLECYHRQILSGPSVDKFISEMLRSRIGRRVLAQQHLALTNQFVASTSTDLTLSNVIGILDTQTSPIQCIHRASTISASLVSKVYPDTRLPEIRIVAQPTEVVTFPFVPEHLEFILMELFKNAHVATLRHRSLDPIDVTLCAGPDQIVVRISDRGGGIQNHILPHLFSFARPSVPHSTHLDTHVLNATVSAQLKRLAETPFLTATVSEQAPQFMDHDPSVHPTRPMPLGHLGLGAPLAKVYADYWHGQIEVVVLDGLGTDVYVRVPRQGTSAENVSMSIAVDAR